MKTVRLETAGRLVRAVIYTRALATDSKAVRQAKMRCSSAAREAMNLRQSWQKLEVLMAANFGPKDMVVTLTYRDARLPDSKAQAVNRLRRFLRDLRDARKLRGQELRYVYCTEGYHGDKRWHHHVILNAVGNDYDEIRSLWAVNGDDVDFQHIDQQSFEDWARYLTKEPREHGKPRVGEHMYVPSRKMKKPVMERASVSDTFSLTVPRGAVVLDQRESQNVYGEYIYIKYLLPRGVEPESLGSA